MHSEPKIPVKDEEEGTVVGKRLAVTNLDWDAISASDLLVLFRSFCHSLGGSAMVEKV